MPATDALENTPSKAVNKADFQDASACLVFPPREKPARPEEASAWFTRGKERDPERRPCIFVRLMMSANQLGVEKCEELLPFSRCFMELSGKLLACSGLQLYVVSSVLVVCTLVAHYPSRVCDWQDVDHPIKASLVGPPKC